MLINWQGKIHFTKLFNSNFEKSLEIVERFNLDISNFPSQTIPSDYSKYQTKLKIDAPFFKIINRF